MELSSILPELYSELREDYSPSWYKLSLPTGLLPSDYLKFANKDIESNDEPRCLVNALSNAKRALHYQVEILTDAFGIEHLPKQGKNINFPTRLRFFDKCGIVSPRILSKLNKVRNAVEHDYYIPTRDEVEDYIDVVELFLAATERFFYQFPSDVEFLCDKIHESAPEISFVEFFPDKGIIQFRGRYEVIGDKGHWQLFDISMKDDNFFSWLRYIISNCK
ncbi:hypothetical protein J4H18_23100 [Vibrio alginolyticus]|uniref:hypothetical protein n=1 Tax=Vibrio alginolyticus TaxID=663 RepID=UPI001BD2A7DB|nr:hypothetical protein [Vibrio alginolyticus]MBS9866935.1 hypothetical protein [Vibrio alginolyticus]MBS9890015.1 hypothetical protein [Vibrio alginolyticus]MCS0289001.1 hypothetical protein [Vibrio alginolyticus]